MTILLGSVTQIFIEAEQEKTLSVAGRKKINERALYLLFLAIAVGLGHLVSLVAWDYSGLNIITRTRTRYFESVLKQDITLLDSISAAEITTQLKTEFDSMQEGVSEKIDFTLFSLSSFVSAFIITFWRRNWKLAIIMASVIVSLATQRKLLVQSDLSGNIHFIVFAAYALAFWEEGRLLVKGEIDIGGVVNVLFVTIIGTFALGQTLRQTQTFGHCIVSGQRILEMIDEGTKNDARGIAASISLDTEGDIIFNNVRFAYLGRPDVIVLEGFHLRIDSGKTTALLGCQDLGNQVLHTF